MKLNQTQEAKIQTLWQEERPTISADLHEFLTETKEMNAIAVQANPDQSEVEEVADREAATIGKFLMEKMLLQSKIYSTILTPGQRESGRTAEEVGIPAGSCHRPLCNTTSGKMMSLKENLRCLFSAMPDSLFLFSRSSTSL